MTWNGIDESKYALLTTYRKDGTPVATPVWIAPDGDRLVVWTNPDTGKVKRIRRNPEVSLQTCDARGKTTSGPVVRGHAEVLGSEGTERVRAAVIRKYPITGRLLIRTHRLFKGADGSVGLTIAEL